jgi:hypothetical protein
MQSIIRRLREHNFLSRLKEKLSEADNKDLDLSFLEE